jgi:5-methyltetrahydropteroyltriglutamate--homocysteine methyltransferase
MLTITKDKILPTAIVGSYPRPHWYRESLHGRPFKVALADAVFREQYLDAVTCILNDQARAGLDILTDGDARFDLDVGGRSWFFYPLERIEGIAGHRDRSPGWSQRVDLRPGQILWEVQEAYQAPIAVEKLRRGPLEYAAVWQVAQRLTERPVKFGAISGQTLPSMLWNEAYPTDRELVGELVSIMNAELKDSGRRTAAPLPRPEAGDHRGRARFHDGGIQPRSRGRGIGNLGSHLLGQPESTGDVLGASEL